MLPSPSDDGLGPRFLHLRGYICVYCCYVPVSMHALKRLVPAKCDLIELRKRLSKGPVALDRGECHRRFEGRRAIASLSRFAS